MATCGISAVLASPAQAASFSGFGCSDNPNCQYYFEYSNVLVGAGAGTIGGPSSYDGWNLFPSSQRVSSLPLFDSTVPPGPQKTISTPYSHSIDYGNFTVFHTGNASARLDTTMQLGQLKALVEASAEASINVSSAPTQGGLGSVTAGGGAQAYLGWGDTLTITSSSKAIGEYAPFELVLDLDRFLSASGKYGGGSQAYVGSNLSLYDLNGLYGSFASLSIGDTNFYPSPTRKVSTIAFLPIGSTIGITGVLDVGASATASTWWPEQPTDLDYSIVDASHTANYYLILLEDGVSYTSASGRTYLYSGDATPVPTPALLPGLIGLGVVLQK